MKPNRREFLALGVGALAVATLPRALRGRDRLVRRQIPVMGTLAEVAVRHPNEAWAQKGIDAALAELRRVDRTMSRFRADSEIGRTNAAAGRGLVNVCDDTAAVLAASLAWAGRPEVASIRAWVAWPSCGTCGDRHEPPTETEVAQAGRGNHFEALEVERTGSVARAALTRPWRGRGPGWHRKGIRRRRRARTSWRHGSGTAARLVVHHGEHREHHRRHPRDARRDARRSRGRHPRVRDHDGHREPRARAGTARRGHVLRSELDDAGGGPAWNSTGATTVGRRSTASSRHPSRCGVADAVVHGPDRRTRSCTATVCWDRTRDHRRRHRRDVNEHNVIYCATKWAGFSDDDIPTVVAALDDLSSFPTFIDRMIQGLVNQLCSAGSSWPTTVSSVSRRSSATTARRCSTTDVSSRQPGRDHGDGARRDLHRRRTLRARRGRDELLDIAATVGRLRSVRVDLRRRLPRCGRPCNRAGRRPDAVGPDEGPATCATSSTTPCRARLSKTY